MNTPAQVQAVGMAWFKPENFVRLRAMFEDGHKLHRTYPEWLKAAEAGCDTFEKRGVTVVRVDIDPDQFPEWCKSKGLQLNAAARTEYANFIAYKTITGVQNGVH
jgi:hypothetical protein